MAEHGNASPRRSSLSSRHGVSRDAAKTISACLTCRRKKVKCSGDAPCTYCSRRDLECKFPEPAKKRVYSVTRIQDLQERLARYESQASQTESPNRPPTRATAPTPQDNATQVNAASTLLGLALDQSISPTQRNNPSGGNASNVVVESSPRSGILADSSLSSIHTFGSRLQTVLEHPRLGRRDRVSHLTDPGFGTALKPRDGALPLPSEEEARRLFDSMTFFIGHTQHHVDTREFSDRLAFFYSNLSDASQTQTPWYLEMLLVFAIGKLFSGSFDDDERSGLPGSTIFAYVQSKLPSLGELYVLGKLGIEIHALAAVYLQNANRKEEAYLYISSALRLATTHGYHRKSGTGHLLQSEKVHLNRLWWTVYMQERRLAAATGNPSSILDEAIEVDMPKDSPGFPPALPLRTNIKIARVTGRILPTIYEPGTHPEETFVPNVQGIVQSLYWIAKEIPSELSTNTSDLAITEGDVSLRTSAYLHMMLYQAILLTIRPVMLHVSKLIFDQENGGGDFQLGASPLGRLSRTCSEAARRLLEVLMSLRKKNILTTFGFFDLDAIFSAAFIMILTLIIDSTCEEGGKLAPRPGLSEALDILDYLVGRGNNFALQRAREVRRMRDHLSTFLDIPKNSPSEFGTNRPGMASMAAEGGEQSLATTVFSATGDDGDDTQAAATTSRSVDRGVLTSSGRASQLGSRSLLDSSLWNDISYLWMQPAAAAGPNDEGQSFRQTEGMAELLPEDVFDWNSIYRDQDLSLTGQDLGDFGELERHILGFSG
ncbi:uncharacterized protein LY79DRAFT_593184 [Colletotrichum navitas]|uniref:Zn(2)-C6 fungal-type domain-containing protein n=1 Tax=Colletotrichum navitas TaxID=681940 RepID=A0AAD8PQY0_9PEZI|nr:uncharacterized protein LY79DRAFT_593184 [Colletotrichum navitas]KAK1574622.1 hypothetical protein LY79DRAFT_593184 [Colletotrichum navitas]